MLTVSRCGKPNETFDTPKTVWTPSFSRTIRSASSVTFAASGSALTAMVRTSTNISFLSIPYAAAVSTIWRATANRPSAVAGMPFSSSVSATTTPPYFRTRGNTASIDAFLPFTELTKGLPLYIRIAASKVPLSAVSICNGRSSMACSSLTVWVIQAVSSISGNPTLTSRICAPASC